MEKTIHDKGNTTHIKYIVALVLIALLVPTSDGSNVYVKPSERDCTIALEEEGYDSLQNLESFVRMPDSTECDLVSRKYTIEVEWAYNWQESIGQSVLYSIWMDKQPAIVLITESPTKDKLHILRCKLVCQKLNIKMYVVDIVEINRVTQ